MKKIIGFIKSFIFSSFLLYGYNLIAVNFNLIIPINIINILFITLLGAPGLFALVMFKLFVLWGVYGRCISWTKKFFWFYK